MIRVATEAENAAIVDAICDETGLDAVTVETVRQGVGAIGYGLVSAEVFGHIVEQVDEVLAENDSLAEENASLIDFVSGRLGADDPVEDFSDAEGYCDCEDCLAEEEPCDCEECLAEIACDCEECLAKREPVEEFYAETFSLPQGPAAPQDFDIEGLDVNTILGVLIDIADDDGEDTKLRLDAAELVLGHYHHYRNG